MKRNKANVRRKNVKGLREFLKMRANLDAIRLWLHAKNPKLPGI
jgi:hypothetical protein